MRYLRLAAVRVGRTTIAAGCGDVDARAVVRIEGKDIRTWRRVDRSPHRAELERPEEVRGSRRRHRDNRRQVGRHGRNVLSVRQERVVAGRSDEQQSFPCRQVRSAIPRLPRGILIRIGSIEDASEAHVRDRISLARRIGDRFEERTVEGEDLSPALSETCRRSKPLYAAIFSEGPTPTTPVFGPMFAAIVPATCVPWTWTDAKSSTDSHGTAPVTGSAARKLKRVKYAGNPGRPGGSTHPLSGFVGVARVDTVDDFPREIRMVAKDADVEHRHSDLRLRDGRHVRPRLVSVDAPLIPLRSVEEILRRHLRRPMATTHVRLVSDGRAERPVAICDPS